MRKLMLVFTSILAIIIIAACKKNPGEGGRSSITGYVHATDYDEKNGPSAPPLRSQNAEDTDVYIIYGNDLSYGDRIKTNAEGRFEFKYLRKGNYKIYVYSEVLPVSKTSPKVAITKSVEIVDKKKSADAGRFEINRKY